MKTVSFARSTDGNLVAMMVLASTFRIRTMQFLPSQVCCFLPITLGVYASVLICSTYVLRANTVTTVTKTYICEEKNGLILFWHHADDEPPSW